MQIIALWDMMPCSSVDFWTLEYIRRPKEFHRPLSPYISAIFPHTRCPFNILKATLLADGFAYSLTLKMESVRPSETSV
jgi:hypothetical protein